MSFRIGFALAILGSVALGAEPVAVRHSEGLVRGFLVLRTLEGEAVADGDLFQHANGNRVTTELVFRFKDGSVHDETAVYTQRQTFRLISDHLVQKGPTFRQPLDMSIDAASGNIVVHYTDDHGEQKTENAHMTLPPDLANGVILTLLKNVNPNVIPKSFSYVAATPKPRLVKLILTPAGEDRFSTGTAARAAAHYVLKVDAGGIAGLLAPLLGKEPPDSHVWILGGETPAFVKAEQALFLGGPVWRIELTSPVWPKP
jgi:hypothetical protein